MRNLWRRPFPGQRNACGRREQGLWESVGRWGAQAVHEAVERWATPCEARDAMTGRRGHRDKRVCEREHVCSRQDLPCLSRICTDGSTDLCVSGDAAERGTR